MRYFVLFIVAWALLTGGSRGEAAGVSSDRPKARWENTLLAFQEDIKNRSFWDWMKAHTSGFKPLHRYEGVLELGDERIVFDGEDSKSGAHFHLEMEIENISDLYLGWDEVFTGFPLSKAGDRAYPWNKPLRLKYRSAQGQRTIYLFIRFHHKWGIRASQNEEAYEILRRHLEEVR